jgi:Zn-finger nucleic acid-binding protein
LKTSQALIEAQRSKAMKCPVCKTPDLMMTERQSIEIDYCPSCRGVWLDRGELDKLVAQMNDAPPARAEAPSRSDHAPEHHRVRPHYDSERRYDERHRGDYRQEHGGYRKKRSLFDIFDFD